MRPAARVAIVVDSAASLPAELSTQPLMHVAPMQLLIDGKTYLDGIDMTPGEFYRRLRGLERTPTTSAPSPEAYLRAFQRAGQEAESILCLTVSRAFSASHEAATAAASEAKHSMPHAEVAVMDTDSAAGGEALVATAAWRSATDGGDLRQVRAQAEHVAGRVWLYALVDTLYFLWKGGRVPRLAHAGTALLQIKPLLEMAHGKVHSVARPRNRARATRKLLELTRGRIGSRIGSGRVHASVLHADAEEDASRLSDTLSSEFDCAELYISEFSPVLGAHTGPGLLGIAFWTE